MDTIPTEGFDVVKAEDALGQEYPKQRAFLLHQARKHCITAFHYDFLSKNIYLKELMKR